MASPTKSIKNISSSEAENVTGYFVKSTHQKCGKRHFGAEKVIAYLQNVSRKFAFTVDEILSHQTIYCYVTLDIGLSTDKCCEEHFFFPTVKCFHTSYSSLKILRRYKRVELDSVCDMLKLNEIK